MARSASATVARNETELRLSGIPLMLARIGCVAIALFSLALFVPGLQLMYQRFQSTCATADTCLPGQLTAAQATTLQGIGVSLEAYALFELAFTLLIALIWFVVAAIVLARKSDNWMVLLIVAQAFTQGASSAANIFLGSHLVWDIPSQLLGALNSMLLFAFLATFPTGRFVPRWLRWFLIPALILAFVTSFVQVPFEFLYFFVVMTTLIIAQVYRYRRVSTPLQRQQTKWVVLALAVVIVGQIASLVPVAFNPSLAQPDSLYFAIVDPITNTLIALCAVAFAFAILRYRLYEVDVIIRRTLIYGSLSLILSGVYIVGVIGVQTLVNAIARAPNGKTSPVLIVITTLAIAALFQPLRRAIQRFIDRRFYRSKYDTRKTLEAFSATLRQEVDLSMLTGQLVSVVTKTMQPEHISLWLRENERRSP
jgi:hypothetical protein